MCFMKKLKNFQLSNKSMPIVIKVIVSEPVIKKEVVSRKRKLPLI